MRHRPLLLLASALLSACGSNDNMTTPTPSPSPPPGSRDWPMYGHDNSRTGYNAGEKTLTAANVSSLAPRFHATLGMGDLPSSSGPVMADGRVCAGSSIGGGDNYFCFDAATGARLWSANVGHPTLTNRSVGIGATAAISGGVLVVGGGDAAYYALAADTGRQLWRHPLATGPDPFAWASPLIANGLVYVGVSSAFVALRGELRALDVESGVVRAQHFFVPDGQRGADIWNSPTLSADGGKVLVATGNDFGGYDGPYTRAIVALDPPSLGILDAHREAAAGQDLDFGTTPVVFRDSQGRALVGANNKNGVFYAYDVAHVGAGAVWTRTTGISVGVMPAYDPDVGVGGTLFIVGDNGVLYGVDPATGTDRFAPVAVGFANGNIALANGLVFMGAGNGSVAILEASTGTLLRTLAPDTPGPTFSGPIVANGMVYAMAGPSLNGWGLP
jgi:outer membrane protein assembly factor BamB